MAAPVTTPDTQTTLARVKWIMRLAASKTKVQGMTGDVINQLSAAIADVLAEEGMFFEYQSKVDRECRALEDGS